MPKQSEPKYGAQLVQRMHEDLRLLLQDYHELRGPLEHREIDDYVQRRLERIVEDIQEIEQFWNKNYLRDNGPLHMQETYSLPDEEGEDDEGLEGMIGEDDEGLGDELVSDEELRDPEKFDDFAPGPDGIEDLPFEPGRGGRQV
jgi:hypothetical protein